MGEHHGKVWWSELNTRDVDKALAYYKDICGYSFDMMPMEEGDYHVGMLNGAPMIGIMSIDAMPGMDGIPSHWMTYLAVDDVDVATQATDTAGGVINRAPWDIQGVGRMSIVTDPSGAVIGLITPSEDPMA